MSKKKILLVLYINFCFFVLQAQNLSISGKVSSKTSKELIAGASIVVLNKENKIIGYDYTDENGIYTISFNRNGLSKVSLEANSLGFSGKVLSLGLVESQIDYIRDFILEEKIEILSAVVLEADEKIEINRDTISYRISAFKDGAERTVEDMLKKLPGIEVSNNGIIKALGKPIQKILIEGDDLANSNYKIISKNLDVSLIDKIEIISNYDENSVLRQFLDSEKVVLNLKLKDSKKSILFGKVELGAGAKNRFLADVNTGLINPDIKLLDLAFANNTGTNAKSQFDNYIFTAYNGFNDFSKDFSININPIIYLEGSTIEIEDKNYIENITFANNLLLNKRFSNNLKLRNALYFYSDNFEKQYSGKYLYFVEPQDILFTEQNQFDLNNLNLSNDLEIVFTPSINTNLTFSNTFLLSHENYENKLIFNSSQINQFLKNESREFETKLQFTQKIKGGAAVVDLYLGSKNSEPSFTLTPNTFVSRNISENTNLQSNYDNTLDYQGIDAALVYKMGKTAYSATAGFQHVTETINSSNHSISKDRITIVDSLSGRNSAQSFTNHLQLKFQQEFFQNVFFIADVDTKLVDYKKNDFSKTFFLSNPSATIRIRKTKTGSYRLGYAYSTKIPRLSYFTDNFLVKSYRSLNIGSEIVEPIKTHRYSFSHTFSNVKERILFSSTFSYLHFENEYSFESILNEKINISRRTILPGQEILLFQTGFTTYIDWAKTSFKIGYQQQYSKKPIQINNRNIELKNRTSSFYTTGTTYFKNFINLKYLVQYSVNTGINGDIEIKNHRYKYELKTVLKFSEEIIANIESKGYIVASQFYETNNAEMEYQPKDKNWAIGAKFQNIFNNESYIFESATNYVQSTIIFTSVPRYGVIYVRFRF